MGRTLLVGTAEVGSAPDVKATVVVGVRVVVVSGALLEGNPVSGSVVVLLVATMMAVGSSVDAVSFDGVAEFDGGTAVVPLGLPDVIVVSCDPLTALVDACVPRATETAVLVVLGASTAVCKGAVVVTDDVAATAEVVSAPVVVSARVVVGTVVVVVVVVVGANKSEVQNDAAVGQVMFPV
jgi:hypothetical protein